MNSFKIGVLPEIDPVGDHPFTSPNKIKAVKFEPSPKLNVTQCDLAMEIPNFTCPLCGHVLRDGEDKNFEHPLPAWVYRLSGESEKSYPPNATFDWSNPPTWEYFGCTAHSFCNSEFGRILEQPASKIISRLVNGLDANRAVNMTSADIEIMLNWFDKVRISFRAATIAAEGNLNLLESNFSYFANYGMGLKDRFLYILKIDGCAFTKLDLVGMTNSAFASTPVAFYIRIRSFLFVFVSAEFILSDALGVWGFSKSGNFCTQSSNIFARDFSVRKTHLSSAIILAQPMRQLQCADYEFPSSKALHPDGRGKVFRLEGGRWVRVRSTKIEVENAVDPWLGYELASLEVVEWIIFVKRQDNITLPSSSGRFFMGSYDWLVDQRDQLIANIEKWRSERI